MTINDAFERNALKPAQVMQAGAILVLAVSASLWAAFRQHNRLVLALVLAFCTVVLPAVYVLGKRLRDRIKHQQTEQRLMMQTRAFLSSQEPAEWRVVTVVKEPDPDALGEKLLEMLHTDGSKLPRQGFRIDCPDVSPLRNAEAALFNALPRQYATRSQYERRFADLAAALFHPVRMPLSELPPVAEAEALEYPAAEMNETRVCAVGA